MSPPEPIPQSELSQLVQAYVPRASRPAFAAALAFDETLAAILPRASEPILGQMRMAWWRDRLGELPAPAPSADPLLNAIRAHMQDEVEALLALLNGWEALLVQEEGTGPDAFISGKRQFFSALGRICGREEYAAECASHGVSFAHAEMLVLGHEGAGKPAFHGTPLLPRLPRELRGIAILGGLSRRVLKRGQGPIFGDRGSAATALRIGLTGR